MDLSVTPQSTGNRAAVPAGAGTQPVGVAPVRGRAWRAGLAGLTALLALAPLRAQHSDPPQTYSLTRASANADTTNIYRDGSKVLVETSYPPREGKPKGFHIRTYIDLKGRKSYGWDLIETSRPCAVAALSGDWGDPFAMSAQMAAGIGKHNPTVAGKETLNGFATKVLEVVYPGGKARAKLWFEEKYGLLVKWEMIPAGGPAQIMLEVKQFSTARPPGARFDVPAACAAAGP